MNMETVKSLTTRLLLGFVLVSIGFAVGKEVTLRRLRSPQTTSPLPAKADMGIGTAAAAGNIPVATTAIPAAAADRLMVYYLHGNIRCVDCNKIEKTAQQIVQNEFSADAQAGRILWQVVNFDLDPALAKQYDVASSTVLLIRFRDKRETAFRRLDEVWNLTDNPAELEAYIRKNIRELLP